MEDRHPAAMASSTSPLKMPTHIAKLTGSGPPTVKTFCAKLEDYFLLTNPPAHLRRVVAAQLLEGPAEDWYNNQYRAGADGHTYEQFKAALLERFSTRDQDELARRRQRTLRLLPQHPLNMVASVNSFNAIFQSNQTMIELQSDRDVYISYMECVRSSASTYPDAVQLLQLLTGSMATEDRAKHNLARLLTASAASAPNVVDGGSGRPSSLNRSGPISSGPRSPPPHTTLHAVTDGSQRRFMGQKRGRDANGDPVECNYCHTGDTHVTVRAKTDTGYNGEILCPVLRDDIATGRVIERPPRRNNNYLARQSLNSYGSRRLGTALPANYIQQ
jgi:hypothetical protein